MLKNLLYGFSLEDIKKELSEAEWKKEKDNILFLRVFARSLKDKKIREAGKIPKDYTGVTRCQRCGLVPVPPELVCGGYVLGCPWCINRGENLPIPKGKRKCLILKRL